MTAQALLFGTEKQAMDVINDSSISLGIISLMLAEITL
jgi:hypothetical protein